MIYMFIFILIDIDNITQITFLRVKYAEKITSERKMSFEPTVRLLLKFEQNQIVTKVITVGILKINYP